MKSTGIIKNVDSLGRIVIPKELRESFGLEIDDGVEIYTEDDKIILKKYHPSCIFCRSTENVTVFREKLICASCLKELAEING